ncbi:MAG: cellulase family glycosylhydrolase, partial [Kiritimatiellales bacterium]|nr:cellulase family glycosylhydrolase [Kiritimatiellales bacterium]
MSSTVNVTVPITRNMTNTLGVTFGWLKDHNLVTDTNSSASYQAAALADTDNDGFANWKEFITDTDPGDSNSLFRITLSGTDISWPAATGRTYTVKGTSSLTNTFSTVTTFPGISGTLSYNNVVTDIFSFFRLEAALSSAHTFPEYAGSMIVLNNWSLWPWNAVSGVTSFNSGTMTAPENGGTVSTTTFANPLTGVDVTDPSSPDFTTAAASYFGFESTGFGVGDSTVGRFNRGESFSITCAHDFRLGEISWREVDGDERVHISWTCAGVPQSTIVDVTTAKMLLLEVTADANTPVVFTNVSPITSSLSGRLRIQYLTTALMYDVPPGYDSSGPDGFVQMFGVNLAGAEFGGYAFWPTEAAQWAYYHSKGLNLMRIPFKWERIQPTLYGTVDTSNLDAVVAQATAHGMKVILDMHNYDRYNGVLIGTTEVPNTAFQDVWRKLAAHYAGNSAIY